MHSLLIPAVIGVKVWNSQHDRVSGNQINDPPPSAGPHRGGVLVEQVHRFPWADPVAEVLLLQPWSPSTATRRWWGGRCLLKVSPCRYGSAISRISGRMTLWLCNSIMVFCAGVTRPRHLTGRVQMLLVQMLLVQMLQHSRDVSSVNPVIQRSNQSEVLSLRC